MIYIKTTSFLKRFHHAGGAPHASLSPRIHKSAALLALLCAGLLGNPSAMAQDRPQSLPAIKLGAGMHVISAEVAQSPEQRAIGLMNRPSMGANEGMLFVFEEANPQCFWMKNTLLPLSIAFIADDGSVVNIAEMKPQSLDSHCSTKPVRYALEMNQGWFAKRGIKAGSKLTGRPWGQ
ncbi:DUF192 domain-containing protein [Roseateles albus]|uniref:DUF192 domain-containing protein n=1 Tax=Roseateles albus TaxID=2987525 RepID=A0ABT5KBZ1_9BURK|nr:DUF192 domain-containing protein [Roseateles albus]MDC8770897.1 DUF192 domain-containing protein [Roseateles albus]